MLILISAAVAQDDVIAAHALASILDDVDQPLDERLAAAQELMTVEGGLVFVEGAAHDVDRSLALGVLPVLASDPVGYPVLVALVTADVPGDVRREALEVLGATPDPDAGRAVHALATDLSTPRAKRDRAFELLAEHHPAILEELGEPLEERSEAGGAMFVTAGSALTGGILLSSVGVWGRNDAAVAIGAVGGQAIGGTGGGLYAATRPVSNGQGLRYASDVSWGLVGSELLTQVVLDPYPLRDLGTRERRQNQAAMLRTLGTGAGAGVGFARMKNRDPDPRDVMESNLAGVVGMQLGFALQDLAMDDGDRWDCEPWQGGNGCDPYRRWYRAHYASGLAGSAVGLGVAGLTREAWNPGYADHLYSGLAAGEASWIAGWTLLAIDPRGVDEEAILRSTASGTFALSELATHWRPRDGRHVGGALYGMVAGNMLGASIPLIADETREEYVAAWMLPIGVVGMGAGTVLSDRVQLSGRDMGMLGLGVPMVTAQVAAYGAYLDQQDRISGDQHGGMVLMALSGSSLGFGVLGQRVDPAPKDLLALSSAGAWGAWYGVLTPIALELEGPSETVFLTGAGGSQAFQVGTAVAVYGLDVDSSHLFVPQLGAVAGATLGSLGVALVNADGSDIAKGAVVGSVVGFAGGGILEGLRPRRGVAMSLPRPHIDVPGQVGFVAAPTSLDGDMGVYAQLTWREE